MGDGEGDIRDTIDRIKRKYGGLHPTIEYPDDEPCQLCRTVMADRWDTVENEKTGEKIDVALCMDCWDKAERYSDGEDVDFSSELRLRERAEHAPPDPDG